MDKILTTMNLFPSQCRHADSELNGITIPRPENISNIIISAMGASAFGFYLCKSLYEPELKIPLILNNDYGLPGFVNENSLFIPVSYSGNTEEVLNATNKALLVTKNVLGITQKESDLGFLLQNNNKTSYFMNPKFNPSGQPRMGAGYTITALIKILSLLNLIPTENFNDIADNIETNIQTINSASKELAEKVHNKYILIVSAEHLSGNAHVFRNQLNESSKNIAFYSLLPELNHHLLEGLLYPANIKETMTVIIIESSLYSKRIQQRLNLTKDVLNKNSILNYSINVPGISKITQAFWLLAYTGFMSYHLAGLNKVNALEIPWVNYFKKQLSAQNEK